MLDYDFDFNTNAGRLAVGQDGARGVLARSNVHNPRFPYCRIRCAHRRLLRRGRPRSDFRLQFRLERTLNFCYSIRWIP